jgi:hypothetical protein
MNIAAVIEHLGPSQKSFYLIKEFNKAINRKDMCVSVFFQKSTVPVVPLMFSSKSVSFLSGFHHNAVCTTISEADMLLKSSNNANKYLYLWDLEWLYLPQNYNSICNVLLDDRLSIIARSESHAQLIENFCNKRTIGILDNWNLNELVRIICRK